MQNRRDCSGREWETLISKDTNSKCEESARTDLSYWSEGGQESEVVPPRKKHRPPFPGQNRAEEGVYHLLQEGLDLKLEGIPLRKGSEKRRSGWGIPLSLHTLKRKGGSGSNSRK